MDKNTKHYFDQLVIENALYEKYGHLIAPDHIYLSVGHGWFGIVESIFKYCDEHKYPIRVMQIKEKFGSMRFYYNVIGDFNIEHNKKISELEALSHKTCDVCGEPGTMGGKGYIVCRCDKHRNYKYPDTNYGEISAYNREWSEKFRASLYKDAYLQMQPLFRELRYERDTLQSKIAELENEKH